MSCLKVRGGTYGAQLSYFSNFYKQLAPTEQNTMKGLVVIYTT